MYRGYFSSCIGESTLNLNGKMMTIDDLKEYDALSDEQKQVYQRMKTENPDWSHEQLMSPIKVLQEIEAEKEAEEFYDSLSDSEKEEYDKIKSEHPKWNSNQVCAAFMLITQYGQPLAGCIEPPSMWKIIKDFFR